MGVITIDPKKIILGESKSEWVADGGFSPDSYGLNLTKKRGYLHFIDGGTDRAGATLTGNTICAAYDKNILGNDNYFLDDEGAFYTYSGTTLTKRQTVTADTFQLGTSDMIQFLGSLYATGQTRVVKLDNSNLSAVDSSWWTGLTTSYRHPLERVEDKLYIGDVNLIHTWDGTTSTSAAITLPTDVNITSLRKHPDGRTLLAFCGLTANFSHTLGLGGRVYYIDTVLKKWTREVETDVQIEGSRVVGGIIVVTFGPNIGYWNGDGVTFLKRLSTSTTTYSHNLVAVEDMLMTRDGKDVLLWGDLGAGRVWWRVFRNLVNSANINNVAYKGDNQLLISFANAGAGYLYELDLDNVGIQGNFYTNRFVFEDEVEFYRADILHDTTASAGISRFILSFRDHNNNSNTVLDKTHSFQSTGKTKEAINVRADVGQFNLTPSNDDLGYSLIRLFYKPV